MKDKARLAFLCRALAGKCGRQNKARWLMVVLPRADGTAYQAFDLTMKRRPMAEFDNETEADAYMAVN